jgi:hypothetical protein
MPGPVDYDISVPAWMPIKIEGTYIYIAVEARRQTFPPRPCAATS